MLLQLGFTGKCRMAFSAGHYRHFSLFSVFFFWYNLTAVYQWFVSLETWFAAARKVTRLTVDGFMCHFHLKKLFGCLAGTSGRKWLSLMATSLSLSSYCLILLCLVLVSMIVKKKALTEGHCTVFVCVCTSKIYLKLFSAPYVNAIYRKHALVLFVF